MESGINVEKQMKKFTNNYYYKFKITLLFFAIFTMFAIPSFSSDAFANHLSEKMTWQLVFISSEPGCSNYHYQIMNKFHFLAGAYLNEYGIENKSYSPECIPQVKYPYSYEKPNDLDLFVLVYDKNLGEDILQSNDVGGFYKHFGVDRTTNHFIVFCDCPNFNFSDPAWILTHELSHFSLFYLGYETAIIDDLVHTNDEVFDQCRENWQEGCNEVVHKIQATEKGYFQSVMPIYKPAIIENNTDSQSENISDDMVDLSKLITQWWASGQTVDNEGFAKAIQLIGSSQDLYKDNGDVEFADHPIKDEITWDELLYGESEFDSSQIMNHIPFKLKSDVEINEETVDKLSNLPVWFKEVSAWWADGNISDEEFVQSIHYLKEKGLIDPYFDFRFLFKN
jgi:hypothetical protein